MTENKKCTDLEPGAITAGFRLEKKQYVQAKKATLYTLRHERTGARLLYFDRPDPNKTCRRTTRAYFTSWSTAFSTGLKNSR